MNTQLIGLLEILSPYENPLNPLLAILGEGEVSLTTIVAATEQIETAVATHYDEVTTIHTMVKQCSQLSPIPTSFLISGF